MFHEYTPVGMDTIDPRYVDKVEPVTWVGNYGWAGCICWNRIEAERLGLPFLGGIPLDIEIRATSDSGTPIVAKNFSSPHAQAYVKIAETLIAQLEKGTRTGPAIIMD